MNFGNIFKVIGNTNPESLEQNSDRRSLIKQLGSKLAVAAVPFAAGSLFSTPAKASNADIELLKDRLNTLLQFEYLVMDFNQQALNTIGLIPQGLPRTAALKMLEEDTQHSSYLLNLIKSNGGSPVEKTPFNFHANGVYVNPLSSYSNYLALAQALKDLAIRAYKGQITTLYRSPNVVKDILAIHSVEARHAAHYRSLRANNKFADVKPWITGADAVNNPTVVRVYRGEDTTVQATIQIVEISKLQHITNAVATESFDEPIDREFLIEFMTPFVY